MILMRRKHGQFLQWWSMTAISASKPPSSTARDSTRVANSARDAGGQVKYFREQVQLPRASTVGGGDPDGDADAGKVVGSAMAAEMYTADNELAEEGHEIAAFDRPIIPMYPASSEIQTWTIWNAIRRVLAQLPPQPDALEMATPAGLLTADDALRKIHLPDTEDDIAAARERLKFDEALAIQTVPRTTAIAGYREHSVACPKVDGGLEEQLLQRLPFPTTSGQQRSWPRSVISGTCDPDEQAAAGRGRFGLKHWSRCSPCCGWSTTVTSASSWHPRKCLRHQHYRTIRSMLGDLAEAGS